MEHAQEGSSADEMLATAQRLAERIGLTPEEQAVATVAGLRLAEIGVAMLLQHTEETGRDVRPQLLSGMLAVALDAVWRHEEFNG